MASWSFDRSAHRYRDASTGRFVSEAHVTIARDTFLLDQQQQYRAYTAQLASGDLSVQEWTRGMRDNIKTSFLAEYELGKGGRHTMTPKDFGTVGRQLRDQYGYLQKFAEEVSAGRLSDAQAQARSAQYASSSVQAHARGHAASWDLTLPAYPAVGTECRSNCRCSWSLEEDDSEIRATWNVHDDGASCDTCISRGEQYNPFTVAKAEEAAA